MVPVSFLFIQTMVNHPMLPSEDAFVATTNLMQQNQHPDNILFYLICIFENRISVILQQTKAH